MLKRSSPIPLTVLVSIDSKFARRPNSRVLQLLLDQMKRVENLVIHVSPKFQGHFVRWLLTMKAPMLQECIVVFHGARNTLLLLEGCGTGQLFGDYAPRLESIKLAGCCLAPRRSNFPRLSSVSLQALPAIYAEDLRCYQPPFNLLRHLILCDIVTIMPPHIRAMLGRDRVHPLELPFLETLQIAATATVCLHLAQALIYPPNCSCIIIVRRSQGNRRPLIEAKEAAKAVAQFVNPSLKLFRCWLFVHEGRHAIRLSTESGESHFDLEFDGGWFFDLSIRSPRTTFLEIVGLDSLHEPPAFVTSRDIFFASLWRHFSSHLSTSLSTKLSLSLPSKSPNDPATLHQLFLSMQAVQMIEVCDDAEIWGNSALLPINSSPICPKSNVECRKLCRAVCTMSNSSPICPKSKVECRKLCRADQMY